MKPENAPQRWKEEDVDDGEVKQKITEETETDEAASP